MRSGLARSTLGIAMRSGGAATATGALAELNGHTDGMAFIASLGDGAGQVAVKDTGTPANNLTNAAAGDLIDNGGTSAKYTRQSDGSLATYASGSPAFGWEDDNAYWLLIEPAATNLLIRSQAFDNAAWTKSGYTASADAAEAPDGTTTADRLLETAATTDHWMYNTTAVSSVGSGAYTSSMFLQGGLGRTWAKLSRDNMTDVGNGVWYDIATPASGTEDAGADGEVVAYGDWARVATTRSESGQQHTLLSGALADSGGKNYAGDAAKGVYAWQAQFEAGAHATSPIPTEGSAVARSADQNNFALSNVSWSASAGTLYLKAKTPKAASAAVLISVDDGTANERLRIEYTGTNVRCVITDGGSAVATLDLGAVAVDTDIQVTFAWEADNVAASLNGGAVVTDTDTGGGLPTVTTFRIGYSPAGEQGIVRVSKVVHVPERVSNTDLPTWKYAA